MAEKGFIDQQIADFIGVRESTLNNWKNKHPDLMEALKDAKIGPNKHVEIALYDRALGYSHPEEKIFNDQGIILRADTIKHYPPDTTACIIWLKNRDHERWRDKHEIEESGEVILRVIYEEPKTDKDEE